MLLLVYLRVRIFFSFYNLATGMAGKTIQHIMLKLLWLLFNYHFIMLSDPAHLK